MKIFNSRIGNNYDKSYLFNIGNLIFNIWGMNKWIECIIVCFMFFRVYLVSIVCLLSGVRE